MWSGYIINQDSLVLYKMCNESQHGVFHVLIRQDLVRMKRPEMCIFRSTPREIFMCSVVFVSYLQVTVILKS